MGNRNRDHNLGHDTWQHPLSEALLGRSSSGEPVKVAVKFAVVYRCPKRLQPVHCIIGTAVTGGVDDSLRPGVISSDMQVLAVVAPRREHYVIVSLLSCESTTVVPKGLSLVFSRVMWFQCLECGVLFSLEL